MISEKSTTKRSRHGGPGRGQGRPKGSLNKITLWKRAVRQRSVALKPGEALAVEKMNRAMHICAELMDFYRPVFDKNGRLIEGRRKTEKFDFNRFMRVMRELRKWAVALAPFQSPRLCAVKVAPPAAKTKTV